MTLEDLSDSSRVREWLARHHSKQLALLDKFETELRLGRSTAAGGGGGRMDRRAVTVRAVELLKSMVGGTRWKTPAQLVVLLRGIGKELHSAGGFFS